MSDPLHESSADSLSALWQDFADPPDAARPRVWWHWMDGNIDPAGIERDLRWLHGVGVRGVQMFDGGTGVPAIVRAPVRPGSPEWDAAIDTATSVAAELGLEFAVATSAGWSAAGAPWVEPRDAMKKVVWSEVDVEGGQRVVCALPPLPDIVGPYQDSPRFGSDIDALRFSTQWRTVAFPSDPVRRPLHPDLVESSAGEVRDAGRLIDESFAETVDLPRDPDAPSAAWIEQRFDRPVTVRSLVIGLPGPRGFGAAPAPSVLLQVADEDGLFTDVVDLPATAAATRTAVFPAVTGTRFRLTLSAGSAADALPPLADGVRMPPVLRREDRFRIAEFALREGGRVHEAEVKAGFGVTTDYYAVDTDVRVDAGRVDPSTVLDVSAHVVDGVLDWQAPPGGWTVLRLGASLTGQTNGPAPADSTGLEVDKLDGSRVAAYLDRHLEQYAQPDAPAAAPRIGALLSDSIESGAQNWTDDILARFAARRGYDATPWLPALAGHLVGDAGDSDRFLYDYRRTIADLVAAEYYGTLSAKAHDRGMVYYAEALEDARPQLGDDLAMRAHADVPMGAMWDFDPRSGPRSTYVADLKGASSVAHVHGRAWTGAEAFTSFERPWSSTPQSLKHVADLQLALGVTRFCIHTSPHQPVAAPPPGIALAPFLGQVFTVNETWSPLAAPWIDYLARCSALLAAGEPAVDIAVFVGEEAPVTGLFADGLDLAVPNGFDFDYVGADALEGVLRVEAGRLVADGASYDVLALGGSSRRMTVGALHAVARLVDAGARLVGSRPERSPSLGDDLAAFDALCDDVWGPAHSARVIETDDLADGLTRLGLSPSFRVDAGIPTIARRVGDRRVVFVANPAADPVAVRMTVPDPHIRISAWDPVALRALSLPVGVGGLSGPHVEVVLPAFGSLFLVERGDAAPAPPTRETVIDLTGTWMLDVRGFEPVASAPDPRLWTEGTTPLRGFSGTGVYRLEAVVPELDGDRVELDLDRVRDIARVRVNGVDCGIAWTPPFRVDVTGALRAGRNTFEVAVTNPWRNRLIAEAQSPTGELFPPMAEVFEPDAAPLPAGLAGRARLVVH